MNEQTMNKDYDNEAYLESKRDPIVWMPTTAEQFDEKLSCMYPEFVMRGGFLVGEASDAVNGKPRFQAYRRRRGDIYEVANRPMTMREFRKEMIQDRRNEPIWSSC